MSAQVHYHPFFFLLMALVAMTELGLTAFLINAGNEHDTWPSPRYHVLLIYICFNAVWTTLFATSYVLWVLDGAVHILASIASSVSWLIINTSLWAVAAAFMHHTRTGGNCAGVPTISRFVSDRTPVSSSSTLSPSPSHSCRQSLTVEALCWTELGLSGITLLATCIWVGTNRQFGASRRSSYVSDSRRLV